MSGHAEAQTRQLGPLGFFAWSVVMGVVGAFGAVLFRGLIAFIHNLLFLGQWSFHYDTNVHTPPSPWGPFVILVPVLGAAGVAFLVSDFAPEAKGHGVPEVMDAIYYNDGVMRPIVAVIKSLASALSIGSGGSVGREGPIIQIGASFGSTLGQKLHLPTWQTVTLIAAGAGAGMAATFNTPIGGLLFAVEIMLHEVSARTLVPVTIATVTSSYIGRLILGNHPSFIIPPLGTSAEHATDWLVLLLYPALGVIVGLLSIAYIRSIYFVEDIFEKRVPGNYYTRHMLGMLVVGLTMYLLLRTTGHYSVEGVGYATVQDILSGRLSWFLLVLLALKLMVTSLTLGSGASGGIFSPALYLGATLGGVYGMAMHRLFGGLPINPTAFAVAGMAGVVGGSTGAAIAAVVMIFEMTMDYTVIIPMTVTVALSYGVRSSLLRQSIYTLKLTRRGHHVPDALQANLYHLKTARDAMSTEFEFAPADGTVADFVHLACERPQVSRSLVKSAQGVVGFLTRDSIACGATHQVETTKLADLADRKFILVNESTTLLAVITRLRAAGALLAVVIENRRDASGGGVCGVLAGPEIASAVIEATRLFSK